MKKNLKITFTIKVSLVSLLMGYLVGNKLPISSPNPDYSLMVQEQSVVDIGELTNRFYFDVKFDNPLESIDVSFYK